MWQKVGVGLRSLKALEFEKWGGSNLTALQKFTLMCSTLKQVTRSMRKRLKSQVALVQGPSIDFHTINYTHSSSSLFVNVRWTDSSYIRQLNGVSLADIVKILFILFTVYCGYTVFTFVCVCLCVCVRL